MIILLFFVYIDYIDYIDSVDCVGCVDCVSCVGDFFIKNITKPINIIIPITNSIIMNV
jgi:hypothetical protein